MNAYSNTQIFVISNNANALVSHQIIQESQEKYLTSRRQMNQYCNGIMRLLKFPFIRLSFK